MKNLIKIVCIAMLGFSAASSAHAQLITVTNPDPFALTYDTVAMMNSDVTSLYAPPMYNSFVFTTDFFSMAKFHVTSNLDPYSLEGSYTSLGEDTFFKLVENPNGFSFQGFAEIGFFGNESGDINKLSLVEYADSTLMNQLAVTELFKYNNKGKPANPPVVATISNFSGSNAVFGFSHDNPKKGINTQDDPARFKFFEGFDMFGNSTNSYIFAIDDREDSLIDFDDGFFFIQFDSEVTPVPEPSAIAALALLGLGGILWLRKRVRNRK